MKTYTNQDIVDAWDNDESIINSADMIAYTELFLADRAKEKGDSA